MGRLTRMFCAASEALVRHRVGEMAGERVAEGLLAEAEEDIRGLGMEPERVLRVRADKTRCVVLCRHPRWGRCVYKSMSAQGPSGRRLAELNNARLLASRGGGLFPRVHHVAPTFTVVEYLPGKNLRELTRSEWDEVDVLQFLTRLRELRSGDEPEGGLPSRETARIVQRYVDKALRACRYATGSPSPTLWWSLHRNRRIDRLVERALDAAETVEPPAGLTHGDLYPDNVRVDEDGRRLRFIDEEHLNEGFFGFDCAWLLTQLTRVGSCPPERLLHLYAGICDDGFLGAEGAEELVRAVLGFQLELLATYLRPRRRGRRTRFLLARVRRDLEGERAGSPLPAGAP